MNALSQFFTKLFDILLAVLSFGGHAQAGLIIISLLTGVGMAWLFKLTSNQEKIRLAKDRFKSRVLEMRIYQDDLGAMFGSFFGSIGSNAFYLRHSMKPIIFFIVPVMIIIIQMDARYARRAFRPGDAFILTVSLADGIDSFQHPLTLSTGGGLKVEAGPIWVAEPPEAIWRLAVEKAGRAELTASVDEDAYRIPIAAEPRLAVIGHERRVHSFWDPFLHPGLPAVPAGSEITGVDIRYPSNSPSLIGWHTHWLVVFLVYSLVGALIAKYLFKVEI